ncbi:hypothetical protein LXL04_008405 [Taraxacum kok-saghyz]
MVGVNSSYSAAQNDVAFGLRVSKCRRFTVYLHSVVFPSRRLHPPVHVYQSNGSYFMFSLLLMSSSRYIFYSIVSLPIFFPAFVPFSDLRYAPVLLCRFLPQDVMFFRFVFQSFTGLLLKASGFLCTGLLLKASGTLSTGLRLYTFLYAYPVDYFMEKIDSQDMRREKHEDFGCFFSGSVAETRCLSLYAYRDHDPFGCFFSGFLEDAMFFLLLFQPFGIFYLCSASFRFCSTCLLLKPSAFLYMRTETMSLSDVSFPGISLEDSPRIVGRISFSFHKGKIFFLSSFLFPFSFLLAKLYLVFMFCFISVLLQTFVAEDETDILNGLLTVSVLPRISS